MFETYLDGEISYPYLELSEGEKSWSYIKLSFDRYWFIVEVISNSEDGLLKDSFLVADVETLLDFKNNKDYIILNLYLVHSGWFDSSEGLKAEELNEIWEAVEPNLDHEQIGYIFILKDNSKYVSSSISTPEEELHNKKLILKLQN